MSNQNISDSIKEASDYLNSIEDMGEASINIADRIIGSCKSFLHPPHLKEFETKQTELTIDVEENIKDAKQKIADQYGQDTYMYHQVLANHIINTRIEKTGKMINFLDKLNQKL